MQTRLIYPTEAGIKQAADILKNGGLVGLPTETVYGLAANALDSNAVLNIFKAKGRPQDNPLIVHISKKEDIYNIVLDVPKEAEKVIEKFWPGPLTVILKKRNIIPEVTSAGLDTVAVRMPANKIARDVIEQAGIPIAAPSANTSGKPSPTLAQHVLDDLGGRIDAVIDGGECSVGVESTVITLVSEVPKVLRPGGITLEELKLVLPNIELDKSAFSETLAESEDQIAISPGMKYKHYAPKAKVVIIDSDSQKYISFVNEQQAESKNKIFALCFEENRKKLNVESISLGKSNDYKNQAKVLFGALREIDKRNDIDIIYAQAPFKEGLGLAVYNRLIRAAGFEVVKIE